MSLHPARWTVQHDPEDDVLLVVKPGRVLPHPETFRTWEDAKACAEALNAQESHSTNPPKESLPQ